MKSFIKKNIRFIIIVVICITCSVLTTFATTTLFNSSEVYYNNATSGIQADKVQGAIDELYACASNYAAYNQRLTSAENTIGSGSLTTTSQNLIGAVNEVNDKVANKANNIIVEIKETGGSGNVTSGSTKEITYNVTKSGYKAIGTVGHWGSGTGNFAISEIYVTDNTLHIFIRNISSSLASISYMKVYVLYQKI